MKKTFPFSKLAVKKVDVLILLNLDYANSIYNFKRN